MNAKLLLGLSAFAASALLLAGCSKTDTTMDVSDGDYIQVPIGLYGEITSITESPMTRAAMSETKDLYECQIYCKSDSSKSKSGYHYYAYGYFDNPDSMVVKLKSGYKYKIHVNMIVAGSEKVLGFAMPHTWVPINNHFTLSKSKHVQYIDQGYLYLFKPDTGLFARPNVDRFFGEMTDYAPSAGAIANMDMKRAAFGVKFVASNFTTGTLKIKMEGVPTITMEAAKSSEVMDTVSFFNIKRAVSDSTEYSEKVPVRIVWYKTDTQKYTIAAQAIAFKRNKLTTITFDVKEPATTNTGSGTTVDNGFHFTTGETMAPGDTVAIGNHGGSSNPGENHGGSNGGNTGHGNHGGQGGQGGQRP